MLSDKMQEALNKQINEELYSGYLYLSMSAAFEAKNLTGVASWFRCQALEEQVHAGKFFDFILERGGQVRLDQLQAPPADWDSAVAAFEDALNHERHITGCINDLMKLSRDENDPATESMLKWFVDEQVEEEATAEGIFEQFKLIGDNGYGILMLDRELSQRSFVMPPPAGGEAGG
jgi:ferritin